MYLPRPVLNWLDAQAADFLAAPGAPPVSFLSPSGEPALAPPDGISWRLFANPITLFIGGVAAVVLELAEPRVRHGVWTYSTFRTDPLGRLRRTGLAAMATCYAARSVSEPMIAAVSRLHARIASVAEDGRAYRADDPELLRWVGLTAAWAFAEAHGRYVRPLTPADRERLWAEAVPGNRLFGVPDPPASQAEADAHLASMPLTSSPILPDFLATMRRVPAFPAMARPLQRLCVEAALALLPPATLRTLDLRPHMPPGGHALVRAAARAADALPLPSAPWVQARRRLGLPPPART